MPHWLMPVKQEEKRIIWIKQSSLRDSMVNRTWISESHKSEVPFTSFLEFPTDWLSTNHYILPQSHCLGCQVWKRKEGRGDRQEW
jgi:hypothetical protein